MQLKTVTLEALVSQLLSNFDPLFIQCILDDVQETCAYRNLVDFRDVRHIVGDVELFNVVVAQWPNFSGDYQYPIGHEWKTPQAAYTDLSPENRWGGQYGGEQGSLLIFIIRVLGTTLAK